MKPIMAGFFLAGILLSGCVTRYDQNGTFQNAKLDPAGSAFIAIPQDGSYGPEHYPGSGTATTQAVYSAFFPHVSHLIQADTYASQSENFSKAKSVGCEYMIEPTILHWEDRATEWDGLPDRIEIGIKIFDATNALPICGIVISGASSWWTAGGDKPQDLLAKPIKDYADSLFQTNHPPPKETKKSALK